MDGSAIEFVDAIRSVGIKEQSELRKFINVLKKIEVREGQKYISIEPLNNDLIVDFEIIYNNSLIRTRSLFKNGICLPSFPALNLSPL